MGCTFRNVNVQNKAQTDGLWYVYNKYGGGRIVSDGYVSVPMTGKITTYFCTTTINTMIEIRPLTVLTLADLRRVASGYSSGNKFVVRHTSTEEHVLFELQLVPLGKTYVKEFDHNDDTLERYERVLAEGYSFGAYEEKLLVGLVIGEPHEWNHSLWVWEFHVLEAYRNKDIGKQLMESVAEKAKLAGFRSIVCETQNTNVLAIKVYRKLDFRLEGIDISHSSNDDYPDGEIAVFMKRRLLPARERRGNLLERN